MAKLQTNQKNLKSNAGILKREDDEDEETKEEHEEQKKQAKAKKTFQSHKD